MFRRPIRIPTPGATRTWARTSVLGFIVAAVIAVGAWVVGNTDFREAFLSNFLATLAGVAVGVPIAVWLTLRESDEVAAAQKKAEDERAAARRTQVLEALRKELTEDKGTLTERTVSGTRQFFIPFLQDEVWAAMSDGGELRWIGNPDLLRTVARSYLYVRTIIYLEKQVFDIRHYAGMRIQGNDPDQVITKYLTDKLDEVTLAAIDEGLAAIGAALPT